MDSYLSSLLGMPNILKDADVEQSVALRNEDLNDEGNTFITQNPTSPLTETILCQKINHIVAKVLDTRYNITRTHSQTPSDNNYSEDFDTVATRAAEMEAWHQNLPTLPLGTANPRALQAQLTLRLWYSLAQIVLYRPFLHHLGRDSQDPAFNLRGYESASACIQAAMQAIWVVEALNSHGILYEAYWLNIYMLGFAASILTYFVTISSQRTTIEESVAAAWKARELLGLLAKYNFSARKCYNSLSALLEDLPSLGGLG